MKWVHGETTIRSTERERTITYEPGGRWVDGIWEKYPGQVEGRISLHAVRHSAFGPEARIRIEITSDGASHDLIPDAITKLLNDLDAMILEAKDEP